MSVKKCLQIVASLTARYCNFISKMVLLAETFSSISFFDKFVSYMFY